MTSRLSPPALAARREAGTLATFAKPLAPLGSPAFRRLALALAPRARSPVAGQLP
jgi:hypothetical protein